MLGIVLKYIYGQPAKLWVDMSRLERLGFQSAESISLVGWLAPIGTTALGWIAVTQIRQSPGRLGGLWLAVFDGLLFPLLAVDALIVWAWWTLARTVTDFYVASIPPAQPLVNGVDHLVIHVTPPLWWRIGAHFGTSQITWLVCAMGMVVAVDYLAIRFVWNAVTKFRRTNEASAHHEPAGSASVVTGLILLIVAFGLPFAGLEPRQSGGLPVLTVAWLVAAVSALFLSFCLPAQSLEEAFGNVRVNGGCWNRPVGRHVFPPYCCEESSPGYPYFPEKLPAEVAAPGTRSLSPEFFNDCHPDHSVTGMHDNVDVHYVFYYAGNFAVSNTGSRNEHVHRWHDAGTITLGNNRSFGFRRDSDDPSHLSVNGVNYDLSQGRVMVLHADGTVEQRQLELSLATAMNSDAMGKLVRGKPVAEDAMATFGPVIERVVNPLETHADCFLNLNTGELLRRRPRWWR